MSKRECYSYALQYFALCLLAVLYSSEAENSKITNKYCFFAKYQSTQSTHSPHVSFGGTAHMYCQVEFSRTSSPPMMIASWSRLPRRPTSAPPVDLSFTNVTTNNSCRVDLVIRHVTREYDWADYQLYINNCSCANMSLKISDVCSNILPKPTNQTNFTVTALDGDPLVRLAVNFTGGVNELMYTVILANSSMDDLVRETGSKKFSYQPTQESYAHCVYPVVFLLHNVSMEDAGLYTVRFLGPGTSSNRGRVFFHLKVLEPRGADSNLLLYIILLPCLFVFILLIVVCIGVIVYKRQRKSGVASHSHRPLRNQQYTQLATNSCPSGGSGIIILYDKVGTMRESLENLLEILNPFFGHDLCVDILLKQYPSDWTRWMQENLAKSRHIVILCSEHLNQAFNQSQTTETVGDHVDGGGWGGGGIVEMFKGNFNANNVVNCINPANTILVYLDRPKKTRIIPLPQLRDRKSFYLELTHLLGVVQDNNMQLKNTIMDNHKFREFKDLIQYLQS